MSFTILKPIIYEHCAFYDMGHGKRTANKKYTTAPSKMFHHKYDSGLFFHENGGTTFEEGTKNAHYGQLVIDKLTAMKVPVVPVCHNYLDTPLQHRTNIANLYHSTIQKGVLFSEHSNAITGPGRAVNNSATGMSIWTSPGATLSDVLATKFIEMYKSKFDCMINLKKLNVMEQNYPDGDPDYEARFHMLVATMMPSVLFENLFFDHEKDANTLRTESYIQDYTDLQAEFIKWCLVDGTKGIIL